MKVVFVTAINVTQARSFLAHSHCVNCIASRCARAAAYERGAKPVFPPQHNACIQRNKSKKGPALLARDQAIQRIGRGRGEARATQLREWKKQNNYHRRSLIETMLFRFKSIFGDQLSAKKPAN